MISPLTPHCTSTRHRREFHSRPTNLRDSSHPRPPRERGILSALHLFSCFIPPLQRMRSFLELLQLPPFSSFLIYTRWPGHFEAVAERRRYIYQPNPGLSVYNQWLLPPLAPALDAVACSSEHSLRDAEATEHPSSVYGYVTLLWVVGKIS